MEICKYYKECVEEVTSEKIFMVCVKSGCPYGVREELSFEGESFGYCESNDGLVERIEIDNSLAAANSA
jgi:hypothetical protein